MRFVKRVWAILVLFVMFLWDLSISSLQVAAAVLSPRDITRPRFVTIPLHARTDAGITLTANFISLTPGTLTVDVSDDRSTLLVHDLFAGESGDGTRDGVYAGIEKRVMRVTQP